MARDINDLHKDGENLHELKELAALETPVAVLDTARAVTIGLGKLEALRAAVDAAQDQSDQMALLQKAGLDPEFVHSVAYAMRHKKSEVDAQFAALPQKGVVRDQAKSLKGIVADKGKELAAANSDARQPGRPLGPLGAAIGCSSLRAPAGYEVGRDGIYNLGTKVCSIPIVVRQRCHDVDLDEDVYELCWFEHGKWMSRWVKALELVSRSELPKALAAGTPYVTAVNALEVVGYITAFLEENQIPATESVSRMGWHGQSFLVGDRVIGPPVNIAFKDDADKAIAARWKPKGTVEEWLGVVAPVCTNEVPLLMVYASLASPLLHLISAQGFVIDLWCESSYGKTVALSIAASVWGPPNHETGPMRTWDSAGITGIEHGAWFLRNLPLLLDETQVAKADVLAAMLYSLPNGQGRERGKAGGGVHQPRTWRLVTISTGERAANAGASKQGAVNRTLSINRIPFGPRTDGNAQRIGKLKRGMDFQHGTFGPAFIEAVRQRPGLHAAYREEETRLSKLLEGKNPRAAGFIASLLLAGKIAHEMGLPGDISKVEELLVSTVREGDRDMATEAAQAAFEWASANETKFDGRGNARFEPHSGWLGYWKHGDYWTHIDFRPHSLQQQLTKMGFDFFPVLASWKARRWVTVTGKDTLPKVKGTSVIRLGRKYLTGEDSPAPADPE